MRVARVVTNLILFSGLSLAAAAQEPPHPIMPVPGSGSGADGILSTYTEPQFLQFVPMQSPRGADYGFVPAVVPGDTGWTWSAASPNQLLSLIHI